MPEYQETLLHTRIVGVSIQGVKEMLLVVGMPLLVY